MDIYTGLTPVIVEFYISLPEDNSIKSKHEGKQEELVT